MATEMSLTLTALKKPLDDLYEAAKGEVKAKLKKLTIESKIKAISKSIASVQKVKTMWQIDKEVKLLTFYYPSKVLIDETAKTVTSISAIDPKRNILIQGTVGQGKSVFLRYLCMKELESASRIPIFVELRRYEVKRTFKEFLIDSMAVYGISCDIALFDYLCESGKLVLLLDAFDEIELHAVTAVLGEIETLVQKYPALQTVITSRPDSGVEHSPHFRVYKLARLLPADHKPFLDRIIEEKNKSIIPEVLAAISTSSNEIKTLLRTPLLMTLLVIVFNGTQSVPTSLPAFYEALFQTLLTRHDSTKPGFRRRRATKLGDSELRKLFEAVCYSARQQGLLVLSETAFEKTVVSSCEVIGLRCKPEDFAKDITKVACLMQHEGFEYHFIHKSVVEFHAASFIANAAEESARKFYAKMRSKWFRWSEELRFLSQLDRYRYLKHFLIPTLTEALVGAGLDPKRSSETITVSPGFAISELNRMAIHLSGPRNPLQQTHFDLTKMSSYGVSHQEARYLQALFTAPEGYSYGGPTRSGGTKLGDYVLAEGMRDEAIRAVSESLNLTLTQWRAATTELSREKAVTEFVDP